jgi:hypothetical protein
MGTIVVTINDGGNIGDWVYYSEVTGELYATAPNATPTAGYTRVPNAVIWNYPSTGTGLTAIRITE